jgi:hypothetical protein
MREFGFTDRPVPYQTQGKYKTKISHKTNKMGKKQIKLIKNNKGIKKYFADFQMVC